MKIINSIFKLSNSLMYGGVFYFSNAGNIFIINCFFEQNYAYQGGAIYYFFDENKGHYFKLAN